MANRWLKILIYVVFALALLICGWLVPAYWTAVDVSVVQKAGEGTHDLTEQGFVLLKNGNVGAAKILLQVAQAEQIPRWEKLGAALTNAVRQTPARAFWGNDHSLASLFGKDSLPPKSEPFTEFVIREQNRKAILKYLGDSPRPDVQELLRCRALTETVIFSPSHSASGQAFDTAISVGGLLMERGHLTPGLSASIFKSASAANRGGSSQPLEESLLDLMSLGQRLNWDQLANFTGKIKDAQTLHSLANQIRKPDDQLSVLFSAVLLSGEPAATANYLANFSRTGLKDLAASLRFGAGGVDELLQRNQRLRPAGFRESVTAYDPFGAFFYFAADHGYRQPQWALTAKWIFYFLAGFLFALTLHFSRPAVSFLKSPPQAGGFRFVREILFALGFLLVAILLSEPFLAQESQKEPVSFRLHLPTLGNVVPAGFTRAHPTFMNNLVLLTLLLFFVLQALIYFACLAKLAEIRRQKAPPRFKLKLLENEDHLFDAGLYLGFVGTIVSLILVSLGLIKFSLMAAYSSTSFGIIFVSIFKIFHLRPMRRKLLLQAEIQPLPAPPQRPLSPS